MLLKNSILFGLEFERLNSTNYHKILNWRNQEFVRSNMISKDIITDEMHKIWFDKLDENSNYIFIVSKNGSPFGVFSISSINFTDSCGETGSYLVSEDFQYTGLSVIAGYGLAEIAFKHIKLEKLYCRVLKDNKNALKLNINQGFKIDSERDRYYCLTVSKTSYYNNKTNIKILNYLNNQINLQ
jgi:UDP-4-amino-4,6-dideoxy-N-acetyl-beta-L-altrosamine N-acetyltransferase